MAWWNILSLVLGILCMTLGTVALGMHAAGPAIGLLLAGFVLLLVAGTWSYVADLVLWLP